MSPRARAAAAKEPERRQPWDGTAIGFDAWFDRCVWAVYPRPGDYDRAHAELRRIFDGIETLESKRKFAWLMTIQLRTALEAWHGVDASVLEPLSDWIEHRRWGPAHPRFASLCTRAMERQRQGMSDSRSLFTPHVDDPAIGQACRETIAMLDLESWADVQPAADQPPSPEVS